MSLPLEIFISYGKVFYRQNLQEEKQKTIYLIFRSERDLDIDLRSITFLYNSD